VVLHLVTELLSGPGWPYVIVFAVVALDGVLMVLPGETVVITASVMAAHGSLSIWVVLLATLLGVVVGDNATYLLGSSSLGRRAGLALFRGERGTRRLAWARRQLQDRGAYLVIAIRPIPGARTAVNLAAGMLGMPWRRFLAADAVAAVVWGGNEVLLGYAGGSTFEQGLWKPLLAGLAFAALLSAATRVVYSWRSRRQPLPEAAVVVAAPPAPAASESPGI
jgi:membrane-associated protein